MPETKPQAAKTRSRRGVPNRKYADCTIETSRCPTCQSTARTKYYRKTVLQTTGMHLGRPYTMVVLRYCTCTVCDLPRRDVSHELP